MPPPTEAQLAQELLKGALREGWLPAQFGVASHSVFKLAAEARVDDGTLVHVRSEKTGREGYALAEEKSDA